MTDKIKDYPSDLDKGKIPNYPNKAALEIKPNQIITLPGTDIEQKRLTWAKEREAVDKITDALGLGIDEGIKDTVVAFKVNGFNTVSSCEGHLSSENHGSPNPYIRIEAPNRPQTRFINETETFQQVAAKHGLPVDVVRRAMGPDGFKAYSKAYVASAKKGETPEYQQWREETNKQKAKMEGYLAEFYKQRNASQEVRLRIDILDTGSIDVTCNDPDVALDKNQADKLLLERRVEMQAFTEFLRMKYFA